MGLKSRNLLNIRSYTIQPLDSNLVPENHFCSRYFYEMYENQMIFETLVKFRIMTGYHFKSYSLMGTMIDQNKITMPCKVGITTSPVHKTLEWKIKYPEFTNWRILGNELSYFEAKSLVEYYAAQFGCEASGVDETKENPVVPWYVYYFEF